MKSLQEISNSFHAAYGEQEAQRKAIMAQADEMKKAALRYQRIAAQKMGEYYKLCDKSSMNSRLGWKDLVRSLLVEIETRTGWEFDNKDDLRSFGLRCECPIHIWDGTKDEHGFKNYKAYLTLTPKIKRNNSDVIEWELYYDTGEKNENRYEPGTIGSMNGFDNKRAKVESVEQIIEILQRQMNEEA